MKSKNKQQSPLLYTSILYACGFILFLEWIYPVTYLTDGNSIMIFIWYAFVCFFTSLFRLKVWIKFLFKGTILFYFLDLLYLSQPFLSGEWFKQLANEMLFNIKLTVTGEWYGITPLFQTFLLFILVWLMSYLLYYWFVEMKRIFLFVLLTIIYLAVLDTFTAYDAGMAIIRTFIISFVALALANLLKEFETESIRFTWNKKTPLWLLPVLGIVLLSSLIGFTAPKMDPKWPDPVPFVQRAIHDATGNDSGTVVQKVGYGEDDTNLGGSFIQDDTPVFRAKISDEHYWRVETKDVYTGKGWETSGKSFYELQSDGEISLKTFSDNVETVSYEGSITFHPDSAIKKVVYPYGITGVDAEANVKLVLDRQTESIEAQVADTTINLPEYQIQYDQPSYSVDQLESVSNEDPSDIKERYTQLPDTLPERIGELAEEITVSYETRYEKAKAVEQYFNSNGFTYQTTDVAVPAEEEDYVDQFLFETQVGYCDNFSTSMVVLLRTLDIPARWVKGFTSGEQIDREDGDQVYEITNSNAHSWVEVYFPEVGWVPFEPTQGFLNLSEFHSEAEEGREDTWENRQHSEPDTPEQKEEQQEEESDAAKTETNQSMNISIGWWQFGLITVVLIAVGVYLYCSRLHWQTKLYKYRLQQHPDEEIFQEAYHFLLKVLKFNGLEKNPDQTLREYAKTVDERYETDAMGKLTGYYEKILYKKEQAEVPSTNHVQLWEDLVNKIMG